MSNELARILETYSVEGPETSLGDYDEHGQVDLSHHTLDSFSRLQPTVSSNIGESGGSGSTPTLKRFAERGRLYRQPVVNRLPDVRQNESWKVSRNPSSMPDSRASLPVAEGVRIS